MAVNTAVIAHPQFDGRIAYASASGLSNITYGDWMAASGYWAFAANSGFMATPTYRTSGMGIALDQNPQYDSLGVAVANSALPIAMWGIFRVTGSSGASAETPVWSPVFPRLTSSGFVGQTGATGIGAIWGTAVAPVSNSANPTGAIASGVAYLLKVIQDGSTGQWDIFVPPPSRPGNF